MTPRTTLVIALIGLIIATACAIPLWIIGDGDPANDNAAMASLSCTSEAYSASPSWSWA
jgi:hypothetical protein